MRLPSSCQKLESCTENEETQRVPCSLSRVGGEERGELYDANRPVGWSVRKWLQKLNSSIVPSHLARQLSMLRTALQFDSLRLFSQTERRPTRQGQGASPKGARKTTQGDGRQEED